MSVHLSISALPSATEQPAHVTFAPEFQLALDCCRWNFTAGGGAPVAPPPGLDWSRFVELVRFHRIQGLARSALAVGTPPDEALDELFADSRTIAAANLKAAAHCALLHEALRAAGIDVLFIKGLTLSALAYGDAFLKMSSDIDILVDPENVGPAAAVLRRTGHRLVVPREDADVIRWHGTSKESSWLHAKSGLYVELHSALVDNPRLIPGIGMSSPRQEVPIGGVGTLPTLATDELVAYLFVHGASTAWFRLKWIADISALLHRRGPAEAERLYRFARNRRAGRAPAQALLLAGRLFALPLPPGVQDDIERDRLNRLLAASALRQMENAREPTERIAGTIPMRLSKAFLMKGAAFPVAELARQVADVARRRFFT